MEPPPPAMDGIPVGPSPSEKVQLDFMAKMSVGEVDNYHDYYLKAQ